MGNPPRYQFYALWRLGAQRQCQELVPRARRREVDAERPTRTHNETPSPMPPVCRGRHTQDTDPQGVSWLFCRRGTAEYAERRAWPLRVSLYVSHTFHGSFEKS